MPSWSLSKQRLSPTPHPCRRLAAYSPKEEEMRTLDDKTLLLDRAEFAAMQAAMQTDPTVLRETILERAVKAGKILAAQRDHYRSRYQRDRAGTVQLLASLAPGVKPSDARTLREMERQQGDELLASARAAFPELRGRQADAAQPPVRPAAPRTRRAGWYRRVNGAPVVKDVGRSRVSAWQNYVPPDRGDPRPHAMDGLPTGPAPFPAGLNVGD
jgi:hypothetical protein